MSLLLVIIPCFLVIVQGIAIWPEPQFVQSGNSVLWASPHLIFSLQHSSKETKACHVFHEEQHVLRWVCTLLCPPRQLTYRSISQTTSLCHDYDRSRSSVQRSEALVRNAFDRFRGIMTANLFVPHKFHSRDAVFEPPIEGRGIRATHVVIEIEEGFLDSAQSPESYQLQVHGTGEISISAASPNAVLHALSTLVQIFYLHSQTEELYTPHAPVTISNWPRFQHRGLNLDISRNEITPDDVIRTLDAMCLSKFNRLHLHATDSQSWPLDVPAMPKLALQGAYRIQQQWSPADLRTVQEYGAARGIEVYP